MNEQERQEIEAVRLELHEMFKDSAILPSIKQFSKLYNSHIFRIITKLWKLSHRKSVDHVEELKEIFNSILCLTSEGVEFMSRTELATRIAQDAQKGYDIAKELKWENQK